MKIALWAFSFVFLVVATLTGIGASIGVLDTEWFGVCLFCVAGMFSSAEWADSLEG